MDNYLTSCFLIVLNTGSLFFFMIFNLAVNNIFHFYSGMYSRGLQSISTEHSWSVTRTWHGKRKSPANQYRIPLILYKRVAAIHKELRKSDFLAFCPRSSASEPEHALIEQETLRNWHMDPGYGNTVNLKCVLPKFIWSDPTHWVLLKLSFAKD